MGSQHMNIGFTRCMHGGEVSRFKLNFLQTYKEDNDFFILYMSYPILKLIFQ